MVTPGHVGAAEYACMAAASLILELVCRVVSLIATNVGVRPEPGRDGGCEYSMQAHAAAALVQLHAADAADIIRPRLQRPRMTICLDGAGHVLGSYLLVASQC